MIRNLVCQLMLRLDFSDNKMVIAIESRVTPAKVSLSGHFL